MFNEICIYEAKIDKQDEIEALMKEVAEFYSVPVLDLFAVSGMQPDVDIIKEKYLPDGLHPSDAENRRIAERLIGFLKAL